MLGEPCGTPRLVREHPSISAGYVSTDEGIPPTSLHQPPLIQPHSHLRGGAALELRQEQRSASALIALRKSEL
jgi:hypothetical protein